MAMAPVRRPPDYAFATVQRSRHNTSAGVVPERDESVATDREGEAAIEHGVDFGADHIAVPTATMNAFLRFADRMSAAHAAWQVSDALAAECLTATLELGEDSAAVPRAAMNSLIRFNARLLGEHAAGKVSDDLADECRTTTSAIVLPWMTRIMELNHRPSEPIPIVVGWAVVGWAFDELMRDPVPPGDPDERDKLYRRWLAGLTPEIPSHLRIEYESRWQASRAIGH
jgi:hypothetical protein